MPTSPVASQTASARHRTSFRPLAAERNRGCRFPASVWRVLDNAAAVVERDFPIKLGAPYIPPVAVDYVVSGRASPEHLPLNRVLRAVLIVSEILASASFHTPQEEEDK